MIAGADDIRKKKPVTERRREMSNRFLKSAFIKTGFLCSAHFSDPANDRPQSHQIADAKTVSV